MSDSLDLSSLAAIHEEVMFRAGDDICRWLHEEATRIVDYAKQRRDEALNPRDWNWWCVVLNYGYVALGLKTNRTSESIVSITRAWNVLYQFAGDEDYADPVAKMYRRLLVLAYGAIDGLAALVEDE